MFIRGALARKEDRIALRPSADPVELARNAVQQIVNGFVVDTRLNLQARRPILSIVVDTVFLVTELLPTMKNTYPPPLAQRLTRSLTRSTIRRLVVVWLLGLLTAILTPAFAQPWHGQCAESEGCDTTFSHNSVSLDLAW